MVNSLLNRPGCFGICIDEVLSSTGRHQCGTWCCERKSGFSGGWVVKQKKSKVEFEQAKTWMIPFLYWERTFTFFSIYAELKTRHLE